MFKILGIDHIVITVKNIENSVLWYQEILGMKCIKNGTRYEAYFGKQKINFHSYPGEFQPASHKPTEGSVDICLEFDGTIDEVIHFLETKDITIIEGPVQRSGAKGMMNSVYFRDPDKNLIELCLYPK